MFKYAQLNDQNIVVGISQLSGEVVADNLILINEAEVELGSIYEPVTKIFTPPKPQPDDLTPTIEEQILAENQYQTMLLELNSAGGM